jgi:hypothetical protein
LSSAQLRLGALYIRKTRCVAKERLERFEQLDEAGFESATKDLGTLDQITGSAVPVGEGVIEVLEGAKYLYIARNENLRAVIEQFAAGSALRVLANHFWAPRPESIGVRAFSGSRFQDATVQEWQLKLIRERKPVFNWPVLGRTTSAA